MKVDDIINYHALVTEKKAALQKGMNFRVRDGLADKVSSPVLSTFVPDSKTLAAQDALF